MVLSLPPGPRRYHDALLPLAQLGLPGALLGWDAQMAAFIAASTPGLRARMVFAPMPEIFDHPSAFAQARAQLAAREPALAGALRAAGRVPPAHLRFGGLRQARLLKGAANFIIEAGPDTRTLGGLTRHPFADGRTLPAAAEAVLVYGPAGTAAEGTPAAAMPRFVHPDGRPAALHVLAPRQLTADLRATQGSAGGAGPSALRLPRGGVHVTTLAEYSPERYRDPGLALAPALPPAPGMLSLLLPWNLADPLSAAPQLLKSLHQCAGPQARLLLLPFNDSGPEGLIRGLIRQIAQSADPGTLLDDVLVLRAEGRAGWAALARARLCAWLDGSDPECGASAARLRALGMTVIASPAPAFSAPPLAADLALAGQDRIWLTQASGFGTLSADTPYPMPAMLHAGLAAAVQATRARRAAARAAAAGEA